jgi:hypothetical protein
MEALSKKKKTKEMETVANSTTYVVLDVTA